MNRTGVDGGHSKKKTFPFATPSQLRKVLFAYHPQLADRNRICDRESRAKCNNLFISEHKQLFLYQFFVWEYGALAVRIGCMFLSLLMSSQILFNRMENVLSRGGSALL